MPDITKQIWPLLIVGRGSSAAFYASTLNPLDYAAILAIGDGDAWSAAVRGHHGDRDDPTRYINHPLYLISHFRKHLPEFSNSKVDRVDWAEMNKSVLRECNVQLHDGRVKLVSEVPDLPRKLKAEDTGALCGFKVELEDSTVAYAYKVVMASGAGGHRVPDKDMEQARKQHPDRVLDLDEFAKLGDAQLRKKKVFVLGPNAAIDAVQKAIHYQCEIVWLIKGNAEPPVLATQPSVTSALAKNPEMIHRYDSFKIMHRIGGEISVQIDGHIKYGHYFVYGMGQTGEPLRAIDNAIKRKLTPIYDKNQYLGDNPGTILGYEAEGTGLKSGFEVVGAMSAQVGRAIRDGSQIKEDIAQRRSIRRIHDSIQSAGFRVSKPFLLKDPDFLAKQPRLPLTRQLQQEAKFVAKSDTELAKSLDTLVSLLLNYHAAKNYQSLLNQQTQNMPKGAVADAGQLTSISAAMAAKHTFVPKYVGTQEHTGNTDKQSTRWVNTRTTPGEVNFSTNNATMLQIGLSLKYPFISDRDLNEWVARHMQKLHESGVGYVDNHQFDAQLLRLNQKGLDNLRDI